MALFGQGAQVVFWLLVADGGRFEPAAMGARPDPRIVAIAPVGEVVAALLAGAGVVADLVGGKACCAGALAGEREEIARRIVVERGEPALAHEGGKARARLDGELVEREVAGPQRQRARQFGVPAFRRVAGAGVDEVETDPREMALGDIERGEPLGGIVEAAQKMERLVVERLKAERDAVDPRARQRGEIGRLDRRGIGFESDLDIRRKAPVAGCLLNQPGDQRGRHQRGRAPAKEDRGQLAPRQQGRLVRHVGEQGGLPGGDIGFRADVAVEVAIGAFCEAERPVDVEREGRHCHDSRFIRQTAPPSTWQRRARGG